MTGARPGGSSGFTLLEVMVAMAILSAALVISLQSQTQSMRAAHAARSMTTAVLLARARLADLEHQLYEDGFSDIGAEDSGDFSDEGFPAFRWEWKVETVELPSVGEAEEASSGEAAGATAAAATEAAPGAGMLGALTGGGEMDPATAMMASQFELIRGVVESAVRRGTFTIFWKDRSAEQNFTLQTYFTDPTKVDAAMGLGAQPGQPGQPGQPAQPGRAPRNN
jgi:general secretion pathway protein I